MAGLSMPFTGSFTICSEDLERLREHVLRIENRSGRILNYLKARIQLPEPVMKLWIPKQPPGENVVCQPDSMQLVAYASGEGASVTKMGSRPALDYKLEIGSLPPRSKLEIHFFCVSPEQFTANSNFSIEQSEAYLHYIQGEFQYPQMGEYLQRRFLVLLNFDSSTRTITSGMCEDDDGSKALQYRMLAW
jgi:hypothetical protein